MIHNSYTIRSMVLCHHGCLTEVFYSASGELWISILATVPICEQIGFVNFMFAALEQRLLSLFADWNRLSVGVCYFCVPLGVGVFVVRKPSYVGSRHAGPAWRRCERPSNQFMHRPFLLFLEHTFLLTPNYAIFIRIREYSQKTAE